MGPKPAKSTPGDGLLCTGLAKLIDQRHGCSAGRPDRLAGLRRRFAAAGRLHDRPASFARESDGLGGTRSASRWRNPGPRQYHAERFAQARQRQPVRREIGKLRTRLGRAFRGLRRKGGASFGALKAQGNIAQRLKPQRCDCNIKLHALQTPEVECLAICQAEMSNDVGAKTSLAVTVSELDDGQVLDVRRLLRRAHGGPPDQGRRHPAGHDAQGAAGGPRLPRG